ncbi:hypothetical protein BGW80DRAFT_1252305 [Lactifluus volemus]|nr:hypothetical protein BGW80DRAFT_1252305 [Lactifluus volemus]
MDNSIDNVDGDSDSGDIPRGNVHAHNVLSVFASNLCAWLHAIGYWSFLAYNETRQKVIVCRFPTFLGIPMNTEDTRIKHLLWVKRGDVLTEAATSNNLLHAVTRSGITGIVPSEEPPRVTIASAPNLTR